MDDLEGYRQNRELYWQPRKQRGQPRNSRAPFFGTLLQRSLYDNRTAFLLRYERLRKEVILDEEEPLSAVERSYLIGGIR